MKTIRQPLFVAAMFASALAGLDVSSVRAQFSRGAINPYNPPNSGMSSSRAGFAFTITPFSPWGGPPVLSVMSPNGYAVVPFNPAYPFYFSGGTYSPAYGYGRSGYTTGSSGSYSGYSQASPAPAAVISPVGSYVPRRAFDRWAVQRDQPGKIEDGQQKQEQLIHYLTNPSSGDLSTGAALNAIVDGLQPLVAKFKDSPPMDIDADFLRRLNFTRGVGSIGLLRDQGKIVWPALLLNLAPAEEAAPLRLQIETQFMDAFKQVNGGNAANADNLKATLKSIDLLNDMASGKAQTMTFAENVEIKRFLEAEEAVAFLKQPDAAEWLPGKVKVKPKTVQELVTMMLEKRCRFAPALVGNDAAYSVMHRALASLYSRVAPAQVGANR